MPKLSESQIPAILPILFKIIDFNMLCWNIYLLSSAVVLGWIFSTKDPLDWKQIVRHHTLWVGCWHEFFGALQNVQLVAPANPRRSKI